MSFAPGDKWRVHCTNRLAACNCLPSMHAAQERMRTRSNVFLLFHTVRGNSTCLTWDFLMRNFSLPPNNLQAVAVRKRNCFMEHRAHGAKRVCAYWCMTHKQSFPFYGSENWDRKLKSSGFAEATWSVNDKLRFDSKSLLILGRVGLSRKIKVEVAFHKEIYSWVWKILLRGKAVQILTHLEFMEAPHPPCTLLSGLFELGDDQHVYNL